MASRQSRTTPVYPTRASGRTICASLSSIPLEHRLHHVFVERRPRQAARTFAPSETAVPQRCQPTTASSMARMTLNGHRARTGTSLCRRRLRATQWPMPRARPLRCPGRSAPRRIGWRSREVGRTPGRRRFPQRPEEPDRAESERRIVSAVRIRRAWCGRGQLRPDFAKLVRSSPGQSRSADGVSITDARTSGLSFTRDYLRPRAAGTGRLSLEGTLADTGTGAQGRHRSLRRPPSLFRAHRAREAAWSFSF